MSVRVIRKKERSNNEWTELEMYVDDEKISSIYGNDSAEIQLKGETSELKVKHFMLKSVRKKVRDGDVVEISNPPLVKYAMYLLPVIILLMTAASYFKLLTLWILVVLSAVFIVALMAIKPLQIKDITEEQGAQEANIINNNT